MLVKSACMVAVVASCLFTSADAIAVTDTRVYNSLSVRIITEDPDSLLDDAKKQAEEKLENAVKAIEQVDNGGVVETTPTVEPTVPVVSPVTDGKKTGKQKDAEAKAAAKAQKDADKMHSREIAAAYKAQADSAKAEQKRIEAEQKLRDKEQALADAALAKAAKDSAKAAKLAEKEQIKLEKSRLDSIKQAEKEEFKNLSKLQKDSLRQIAELQRDSTIQSRLNREQHFAHLDSIAQLNRKERRDSIFREATLAGVSHSTLRKWARYYSTLWGDHSSELGGKKMEELGESLRDIMIQIDTTRHDSKAGKLSKKKMEDWEKDVYGKTVMMDLFTRKDILKNHTYQRALTNYLRMKQEIEGQNRIATFYDSLDIANNRKPGERIFAKVKRRAKQREKRIWQEVGHFMRAKLLEDYNESTKSFGTQVVVSKMFQNDSCFNTVRDQLGASSIWKRFSIHTNGIGWLLGVPNIGIEFDLSSDPSSRYSVLIKGGFKPNLASTANTKTRINYSIWNTQVEVRKYWHVGGLQTVTKSRSWDLCDYSSPTLRPDTLRPRPAKLYGFYNGLHRDKEELNVEYRSNELPRDSDTVRIWTSNILKRYWQPFRYNKLSGRFINKPKMSRAFYIGAMAGYERYQYIIGGKGRYAKSAYVGATGGIIFEDLATFSNGSGLDLDIGLGIGIEGTTYEKFRYDPEYDRYILTGGTGGRKIVPYPTLHDVHVTLIYSLRPMRTKAHNLFLTEKFRKTLLEVHASNSMEQDRKVTRFEKRQHLRKRGIGDKNRNKKEYQERQDAKATKKREAKERAEDPDNMTVAERAEFERKKANEENGVLSNIKLREPVQPEKPEFGVIEYFQEDDLKDL